MKVFAEYNEYPRRAIIKKYAPGDDYKVAPHTTYLGSEYYNGARTFSSLPRAKRWAKHYVNGELSQTESLPA